MNGYHRHAPAIFGRPVTGTGSVVVTYGAGVIGTVHALAISTNVHNGYTAPAAGNCAVAAGTEAAVITIGMTTVTTVAMIIVATIRAAITAVAIVN